MKDDITKVFDAFEANYNYLLKRAVSILGNIEDAEDAMQDLAETIITNEIDFREAKNIKALLNTAAYNKSLDIYRKNKRTMEHTQSFEIDHGIIEKGFETAEKRELINKLLADVDPVLKEVFIKHAVYGYTLRELAKELGVKENTLAQKLKRVKIKLTKQYLLFTIILTIFR